MNSLIRRAFRSRAWWLSGLGMAAGLIALGAATTLPRLNVAEAPISAETKRATSVAPVAKIASRSVVNIYTSKKLRSGGNPYFEDPMFRFFFGEPGFGAPRPQEHRVQSLGSGVIMSADGYILSNNHVVEDADDIKVGLPDGKEFVAKLVGTDPQTDVAVLKIEAENLPAITVTDSDKLEVGDMVLAIGNPFGVGQTVTVGHVSALGRGGFGIVDYEDFIQTDASINPGNSGGALVDAEGRLVGINTAIISRTGANQGIGFAVPSNLARSVMELILKEGKVTRGYLGVMIQPVTEDLAREFDLPDAAGALVSEVSPRSPADKAGLKTGDVIVEFNGKKVSDGRHLRLMVAQTSPDSQVSLKVMREGKAQTFRVQLEQQRGAPVRDDRGDRFWFRPRGADLFDGISVDDVDARTRRMFDLPAHVRGAVVTAVDADSPAARAGLKPGDVIQEINRHAVSSAEEAIDLSRGRRGDRLLLRVWSDGNSRYVVITDTRH
jgi:serine protease Do